MKKNNIIVYSILLIVCIILTGIWYFAGYNLVDPILDMVLAIIWIILLIVSVIVLKKTDKQKEKLNE